MNHNSLQILAQLRMPTLVKLAANLTVAQFQCMKQLVAARTIDDAEASGELRPGMRVLESTSGTVGLGTALEAAARGYPVTLTSDPALDAGLHHLLQTLDVDVHIVTQPADSGGYQHARLAQLRALRDQFGRENCFWIRQYHNPSNPRAYAPVAHLVQNHVGRVDIAVFAVGSGGSLSGAVKTWRENNSPAYAVAVDTPGSILFTGNDYKRALRGLGNSVLPRNLDHTLVDEVHWVGCAEAYFATRELCHRFGVMAGPTTGAAWLVARYISEQRPDRNVVFFGPDGSQRYLGSVYDRDHCRRAGLLVGQLPGAPVTVYDTDDVAGPWCRFAWNRRTYRQVTKIDPVTIYAPDLDDIELTAK